jgi:hypothetical protein
MTFPPVPHTRHFILSKNLKAGSLRRPTSPSKMQVFLDLAVCQWPHLSKSVWGSVEFSIDRIKGKKKKRGKGNRRFWKNFLFLSLVFRVGLGRFLHLVSSIVGWNLTRSFGHFIIGVYRGDKRKEKKVSSSSLTDSPPIIGFWLDPWRNENGHRIHCTGMGRVLLLNLL